MGVPKFFRWISERYPAISQLISENRIPEFDALYLDMNGIIHNCTHKDSDSATFRMTEEKMFIAIFNYIEHLYGKIKPQKLFFMAIDGVAPRAKMNQQRARRFRTALDAENARQKAIKEGVELPEEEAFDSNCITPGTAFMANLTKQLKYFINKKVSEDKDWQGVEIILSGHEVPGEGEHKIMEYIRLAKAQPNYEPNLRHCLYGLDADLIMLGLLSHDPHFCLLREEVTFGRQNQKKSKELEHQSFYLMHLSIVREYLELEFQELKEPGVLTFGYDFERILDDFILLAFFVGNDFLPNLPGLHINEGALSLMFKIYKSILPKADGYINEHGVCNVDRLALVLTEMEAHEFRVFESEHSDASWFKGKQKKELQALQKSQSQGKLVLTSSQKGIYLKVKKFVQSRRTDEHAAEYDLPVSLKASDRKFVEELASMLHLQCGSIQNEEGDKFLKLTFFPSINSSESEDDDDEEGQLALRRIFKQIEKAPVVDISADEAKAELERIYQEKFDEWRDGYYKEKFHFGLNDEEEMRKLAENYIEGLQWVLYYYYQGVASWGWFYAYHYSPKIADIKKGLGANLKFNLGIPFRPYQQLMGVLPDRSKKIVPEAYHPLMTNPDSPIIDFYPRDFELDMNGKKMEWEAVVKIPFIDEKRLLSAMATKDNQLTEDEKRRNDFGITLKFTYAAEEDAIYPTSMPSVFPDIAHCRCVTNIFELPTLEGLHLITGLCDGVRLGANALAGFPSLKTLPHSGQLGFHSVNVFQQDSKNESMIVTLNTSNEESMTEFATKKLNTKVHVGYPFLQEALVVAVTDEMFDYVLNDAGQVLPVPHSGAEIDAWRKKAEKIENVYSKRMGVITGTVEILVHVAQLKGLRRTDEGAMVKEFAKIQGMDTDYALQTVVENSTVSLDQRFLEKEAADISEEFPEGTRAFLLAEYNYGRPLEVIRNENNKADIWVSTMKGKEPDFGHQIVRLAEMSTKYVPSFAVARLLGLNGLVLSKITSSFSVMVDDQRQNLGLNLKFEAKKLKVLGYSRKTDSGWEFSQKAIDLIREYIAKFPEFFMGVQKKPTADIYLAADFYPEATAKQKIKEIQTWLKEIESKSFEKVPLESLQMDGDVVMAIENAATTYNATLSTGESKKVKGVPRKALLKPSDAEHRLSNQKFGLGDRIVYVQDSGKVPIATKGTVIGITKTARTTLLDVIFDVSFMSGSTLGERCSPFRGMTIPFSSALNLSNRQLVTGTKASSKNLPAPHDVLTVHGNGFVAAPQPASLQGSFSGALAGRNVHHQQGGFVRGNGAPRGPRGRGGMQQQQQYQHQRAPQSLPIGNGDPAIISYSAAPPPPALHTGRGGGRGRGGRGRGRGRGASQPMVSSE